ncbi:MAG TPA: hypothetical protein VGM20_06020 [Gemmatimonadales bacterium]|jgi:hypothetical protein
MPRHAFAIGLLVAACGRGSSPPPSTVDSAAVAHRAADSLLAAHKAGAQALATDAKATVAQLLKNPATATFDSLIVVQPAETGNSWPAPVVCGRIGGKPGIKGASTMTPFIYQNRINVFVLDPTNGEAFAALRAKLCDAPGTAPLLN